MAPNDNTGEDKDFLHPFGILASTGRPLNDLPDDAAVSESARAPQPEQSALEERSSTADLEFAVMGDVDANKLEEAGWGIIFAPDIDPKIKQALQPLIDHRRAMADPFAIYEGADSVRPNEKASAWLTRRGARLDVVDPANGIPYYLLIVAPPDVIPFEFQYVLDIYWAVGRLWFDTPDEFRQYAESVVRYETGATVPTSRNAALFATEHVFDTATQLFTKHVARPLAEGQGSKVLPLGRRQKFGLKILFGEGASRAALADLLRARTEVGTPALLFSGSHGMVFEADDPRLLNNQGAIVCQDWGGYGEIKQEHWFSAADVPGDAKVHGMMHVFFACFGGGCTELDNFDRMNGQPKRIAPKPFFSKLPQKLLAHANGGALAILAHIERAWAYSFSGDKGGSQIQGFRDVMGRLLRGERIGQATDSFNSRWAALSVQLSESQLELQHGADIPLKTLGRMWVARDDARNYMIFGDPAVRLRLDAMQAEP